MTKLLFGVVAVLASFLAGCSSNSNTPAQTPPPQSSTSQSSTTGDPPPMVNADQRAAIQSCKTQALSANPQAKGRIGIDVYADNSGTPNSVSLQMQSGTIPQEFIQCVIKILQDGKYPPNSSFGILEKLP